MRAKKSIKNILESTSILPAGLLVSGRDALVVGGGKVALRKIMMLLDAGARVRVVAPELCPEIRALSDGGKIAWLPRAFRREDARGNFIVHAATNIRKVNSLVLSSSREAGAICNIVDKGWHLGDFIAQACFDWEGLTVSVSSGGRSCRRSRVVKSLLKRHLESVGLCELAIFGTDHRHLSVQGRKDFLQSARNRDEICARLALFSGISEFFLLETCNRFELVAFAGRSSSLDDAILELLGFDRLPAGACYKLRGSDAFLHMAYVLSGQRSQVSGESQIVSQVKDAFCAFEKAGWTGPALRNCLDKALSISRKMRRSAHYAGNKGGIPAAFLCFLREKFGNLAGKRILVVGTGRLGKSLIRLLDGERASLTACYHSRRPSGKFLRGIRIVPYAELARSIAGQDIAVLAVRGDKYVLDSRIVKPGKIGKGLTIIDLSMPPAADPELREKCRKIRIVDLDGLKAWFGAVGGCNGGSLAEGSKALINEARGLYGQIECSFKGGDSGKQAFAEADGRCARQD